MLRLNSLFVAGLLVFAQAVTTTAQLFTDDLSTGTNWTVLQDTDSSFQFGYDYSANGIPAAPNGGDTIGLKFEVNNTAPADINEIGAFRVDAAFTGQFTFRVDAWINWAVVNGTVGTGTTEFIGVSVGHDLFAPGPWGGSFLYSSEGDAAATDYRLYKNDMQLQAESGQYALGTAAGSRDSSNPILTAAFPAFDIATAVPAQGQTGTQPAGAGGFQWMTLNVEVDTDTIGPSGMTTEPGFARFSMRSDQSGNVVEIGTIDNSNGEIAIPELGGSIGLLMSDLFSSVAVNPAFSFGIFDNVQVLEGLVPLETSNVLDGDYNADDAVTAADYVVWRDGFGNGEFTIDEYNTWKQNFGGTLGAASATNVNVPEPAGCTLALSALLGLLLLRSGRVACARKNSSVDM